MNVNFSDSSDSEVNEEESVDKETDETNKNMATTSAKTAETEMPRDMPLDLADFHKILSKMLKSTDGTKVLHSDFKEILLKTRNSTIAKERIAKYGIQANTEEIHRMIKDCATLTQIVKASVATIVYIYYILILGRRVDTYNSMRFVRWSIFRLFY